MWDYDSELDKLEFGCVSSADGMKATQHCQLSGYWSAEPEQFFDPAVSTLQVPGGAVERDADGSGQARVNTICSVGCTVQGGSNPTEVLHTVWTRAGWRVSGVEDTVHGGVRPLVKVCALWPGPCEGGSDASGAVQWPCLSICEDDKVSRSRWPCSDGCEIVGDIFRPNSRGSLIVDFA
jgi:hypothetical protein